MNSRPGFSEASLDQINPRPRRLNFPGVEVRREDSIEFNSGEWLAIALALPACCRNSSAAADEPHLKHETQQAQHSEDQ